MVHGQVELVLGDNRYRDEWGVERIRPPGSYYYDERTFPLAGEITAGDVARYPMPDPDDPIRVQGLKERVDEIHRAGYAAVLNLPSAFVHKTQYLRGFERAGFTDVHQQMFAHPSGGDSAAEGTLCTAGALPPHL